MIFLSFRTDRSEQAVQTQIRLLLEEQSDQGLRCLPFRLHRLDALLYGKATLNFRVFTTNFCGVQVLGIFTLLTVFIWIHLIISVSTPRCSCTARLLWPVPLKRKKIEKSKRHDCEFQQLLFSSVSGERGGSVVECRTPEREVRGSRPTSAVLCPWARHFTPRKYWLITQEAMAPSRHDRKIVDWDVKPQHNQPTQVQYRLCIPFLLT